MVTDQQVSRLFKDKCICMDQEIRHKFEDGLQGNYRLCASAAL